MKVIKFAPGLIPVFKHQEHDQSSHGNWAGDGVSFKQDRNSLTMQDKSGQTLASVDFVNLGNNRLDVNSIDSFDGGKGYATKVLEKLYSLFPEHSIFWGKTIVPESTHLAQKFSDKYGRTQFMPWGEGVIAGYEWGELYGDTTVKKHEQHDQKTHGSWATGQKGGSGLSHREMYELKKQPDPLVSKVYAAEEKNHNQIQDKSTPAPAAPNRADFTEYSEYDAAYKKYSKDFLAWSKKVTTSLISPMAKKHLDGTPRGVNGYVRDVIRQDWFVEAFGKGGVAGNNLEVRVSSAGEAGAYQIGFKGDLPISILRVSRGYTQAEPTIIHEIAHYATTISATSPHGGHGVEFARNHVFIASKVMGQEFADGLEKAYREAGIPLGD
jgi:putative metallohydrolase (TIGR04338 family)